MIEIYYINEDKGHDKIRNWSFDVTFSKKSAPKSNELTSPLMMNYVQTELKSIADFIDLSKQRI